MANFQQYKRPESVLVVIHTARGDVLLLERQHPRGYWQSVTGSLHWSEPARDAAIRETREETGLSVGGRLIDCGYSNRFEIHPDWRARYAPNADWNTEHVFRVELAQIVPIKMSKSEHRRAEWVASEEAVKRVSSHTNRAAIERCLLY